MADGSGSIAVVNYYPRKLFRPFHDRNERWGIVIAFRRCGKTVACIAELIKRAIDENDPNGRYAYLAPLYNQAKDVAWGYLKDLARPVLAGVPNESELRVDLINGARIRLYGADNPDRLRGGYFNGIILDEYADMRPSVWEVIRPALTDKQGWAVFIGTPKGHTGLYDIWAGKNQWANLDFFRLMIRASEHADEIITDNILKPGELEDAKASLTEEEYLQEYECSFEAAIKGAVYGKLMAAAEKDGRICSVPYDPSALVYTSWDLGIGDPTAIWFSQTVGRERRIIDYYESSGADVSHYAGVLAARGYNYGGHILPHDAQPKQFTSGKSVKDVLESLNVRPIVVQPQSHREDGINAARLLLPMCVFDAKKCERGIDAMKLYRYEFDEKLGTLKNIPVHDWTSHAADAFRYLAEGIGRGLPSTSRFNRPLSYPELGKI
jgi:phage terminase large subunit